MVQLMKVFTYYHSGYFKIADQNVYISRTGWTGEIGYEIYTYDPDTDYKKLWNTLLEIGEPTWFKKWMVFNQWKSEGSKQVSWTIKQILI